MVHLLGHLLVPLLLLLGRPAIADALDLGLRPSASSTVSVRPESYLSLSLLLLFHLTFPLLDGFVGLAGFLSFGVGSQARGGTEGLLGGVPLLAYYAVSNRVISVMNR